MSMFPIADPPLRGDAEHFAAHERARVRAAALHARRVYRGRLGELVHRELMAYADFGYRFVTDALIPQLAGDILILAAADHPPDHRPRPRP
jgi:hypothetical protein